MGAVTATSNQQIYEAIGALGAEVKGLRRDFERVEKAHADNVEHADRSRKALHERVDRIVEDMGEVATSVAVVVGAVDVLKVEVKDGQAAAAEIKRWKQMGVGAMAASGITASAITSSLWYFWGDLLEWIVRHLRQ
jgi:hypothetical protein